MEPIRLRDIDSCPAIALRYATADNVVGRAPYPSGEAWLRPETARKLAAAQEALDPRGRRLKVLDADGGGLTWKHRCS